MKNSNKNATGNNGGIDWDAETARIVSFLNTNKINIQFADEGELKDVKVEGNTLSAYKFEVVDLDDPDSNPEETKEFSFFSKPLLRLLMPMRPLTGKKVSITKTGSGFKTKYTVAPLK